MLRKSAPKRKSPQLKRMLQAEQPIDNDSFIGRFDETSGSARWKENKGLWLIRNLRPYLGGMMYYGFWRM